LGLFAGQNHLVDHSMEKRCLAILEVSAFGLMPKAEVASLKKRTFRNVKVSGLRGFSRRFARLPG